MRVTTNMCLGIRHVGKADEPDETHFAPVADLMKLLIQRVTTTSVAKRLEFSFARTEDEVRLGWGEGKRGANASESMMEEWERMLADMEGHD